MTCSKVEGGRLSDHSLSRGTTPMSPSYSSGGYRVVHIRSDGEGKCQSSGGRGGFSAVASSGGDHGGAREEGSVSSLDSSSQT